MSKRTWFLSCLALAAGIFLWAANPQSATCASDGNNIAQSRVQVQGVDPLIQAETHKSAYQRRKEANERLSWTEQGQQQKEATAAKKAPARKAKNSGTAVATTPLTANAVASTPTGINPAVDILLPNWANSPNIRKFVDSLPGVGSALANNLGQYVSLATADINAYPGSDYYEIALVCYSLKMHTDLPATDLRGYVQLETAANAATSKHVALKYPDGTPILNTAGAQVYAYEPPQYLGASILAQKDRPVRVKFYNYLPKGAGGNLPLPVDTTVMGAGMGPLAMPGMPGMMESYTQNRGTLHLHGGTTPWISDGTPHQWTTPAGEVTQYPKGLAVQNVPDMPDPGPGAMTFYYTNGQSARLLFYHDHAYGITRLNVYAGVAAGYIITDSVEQDLIKGTNVTGGNPSSKALLPTLGGLYPVGIPLVIQDKTFVNDATTRPGAGFTGTTTSLTSVVDPLWYKYVPVTHGGNLWIGHEYMPNENIYNATGFNDMGRWDYGPWMNPPMTVRNNTLPSPTIIPEAFMDTMVVNGTALPYVELPPTLVRFRILNACNDRMLNLQLYKADPAGFKVTDTAGAAWGTEVKMVPAAPTAGFPATWPKDGRDGGVPDPTTAGPDWWDIGNESGFLAQVNVIPQQPVDYDYNRRSVTFGAVTSKALQLPPAVRADVLVDLSKFAPGDTVILYNDNPAPMPLYDSRYDYFTGCPDQTAIGGSPTVQPGFAPNTRTIMQIRIKGTGTPTSSTYLTDLKAALPKAFAAGQDAPIVPESVFNAAYGTSYTDHFMNVADETLNVTGAVQSVAKVVTTLPGLGYTTPPTVTFAGGGGTGAVAKAGLNPMGGITLLTGGSGYTVAPVVTIGPPVLPLAASPAAFNPLINGVQATAVATITGGVVTAITITEPGAGYTDILVAPTVTIAAPTGVGGVAATASGLLPTIGTVGSIVVTAPGTGYTKAPYVYVTGGGGQGATAACMLVGDMIPTMKNLVEGMDMEFGRMDAKLGSTPNVLSPSIGTGPVIGMAMYIDPPTEFLDTDVPVLWRITHIGVDSHALHFHLFDVQVINRVDWTNTLKPPYPEEIGWKDTIRTNPFEDIIVALRPKVSKMKLPFGLPDSIRPLDVTSPIGSAAPFNPVPPPVGVPAVAQITNTLTNFGWEYVFHCHLLGHEENDMMRPVVCNVPRTVPQAPSGLTAAKIGGQAILNWTDRTPANAAATAGNPANEIGYRIFRAAAAGGAFTQVGTALANATTYSETPPAGTPQYRVVAWNVAGTSPNSNTATLTVPTVPGAPQSVTGVAGNAEVMVSFLAPASNGGSAITGYTVTSNPAGGVDTRAGTTALSHPVTGLTNGVFYTFTVRATNLVGTGPASAATAPLLPMAPPFLRVASVSTGAALTPTLAIVGSPIYIDRTTAITSLSAALNGGVLIKTAQADRLVTAANYLTLNSTTAVNLYVCYDKRNNTNASLPTWLRSGTGWVAVPESLVTTDAAASPMLIFKQAFPAGQIILGGDATGSVGAQATYTVIGQPAVNVAPVASNQAVQAFTGVGANITLAATDANLDPLTYSVVTNPANGTLTGAAPNLVYTSNAGYVGPDSFTFRANDGKLNSNTATVTINVSAIPANLVVSVVSVSTGQALTTTAAAVGATEYIDRTYTITSLSAGLAGGVLVRAAQADRYAAVPNYLTLSLNRPATVYVCYDKRKVSLPAWLDATWAVSAETVSTVDTASSPMLVYSKAFPAGQFVLGANYGSTTGALANYFVIAK